MKDINLSDETIIRLYKDAGFRVDSERTEEPVAIILPAPDAPAVEFAEVLKRLKTTPPAVLCPDGEIIGRDDSAEKIDAIKRVLEQRIKRRKAVIEGYKKTGNDNGMAYYEGQTDGFHEVVELLGKPIMDIKQELNPEE